MERISVSTTAPGTVAGSSYWRWWHVNPLARARRVEERCCSQRNLRAGIVVSGNWTWRGGSNPNNKNRQNRRKHKRLIKDAEHPSGSERHAGICLPKAVDIVPRYGSKACWICWCGAGGHGGHRGTQTGPARSAILGVNEGALSYCGARDPEPPAARLRQKISQLVRGGQRAASWPRCAQR